MSLEDSLIRRQVFNQRFAGGQAQEAEDLLVRLYAKIESRLLRAETEFQTQRLTAMRNDIAVIMANGFDEVTGEISDSMLQFSAAESEFMYEALGQNTSVVLSLPAVAQVERAVLSSVMSVNLGVGELTVGEALSNFSTKKAFEINQAINDGILLGSTNQQIASEVGQLAQHRHKSQVNALVRTLTNHAATQSREAVTKQNSEIFQSEEWVATLDDRTTLICGGRDGREYPVGSGPYPPAHWNCRSLRVPKVKDQFDIGLGATRRPEVGADGPGTTTGNTKFDGFMRRQPASFQDEYFSQFPDGAEKAALFRRGGLKIDQFRSETGVNYTLEQLQALNPIAFEKAKISI
jgi:SPP1 gp7 family putative phage head morphogenesis protein